MSTLTRALLPVVPRYVLREFLRYFGMCLIVFLMIYVLVDFFDRFDTFLKYRAEPGAVARYLLFKIPLIITQMLPVATLGGVLLALGMMARHNELTAMRACGISTLHVAAPLLVTAVALSIGILAWNETIVPYASERSRYVEAIEIRKRPLKALLSEDGMWFHGKAGIYNIQHFDARKEAILGLTVYDFDPAFELRRLIEIPAAQWRDGDWQFDEAVERAFDGAGNVTTRQLALADFTLPDRPQDLQIMDKDPEELNFRRLRRHINELSRKGIDTTESRVDLHLKLALPFVPLVMVLVGTPLATRNPRRRPIATSIGIGLVVGFSYWVLLALTISLGHGGAIPPVLAAWTANAVFTLFGAFLFLGPE